MYFCQIFVNIRRIWHEHTMIGRFIGEVKFTLFIYLNIKNSAFYSLCKVLNSLWDSPETGIKGFALTSELITIWFVLKELSATSHFSRWQRDDLVSLFFSFFIMVYHSSLTFGSFNNRWQLSDVHDEDLTGSSREERPSQWTLWRGQSWNFHLFYLMLIN